MSYDACMVMCLQKIRRFVTKMNIATLNFDKTTILKKLDTIGMCINNVCNTGYTLQECDVSFINEQIKHIEDAIK